VVVADGGVEFHDVKATDKIMLMFVVNGFKPLDHGGSVFPLIESFCFSNLSRISLLILPISDLVALLVGRSAC